MEDIKEVALLPCPFCGAAPVSHAVGCDTPGMEDCGYWAVVCPVCNGRDGKPFAGAHSDEQEIAEEAWNRRAELQKDAEPVAYLCDDAKYGTKSVTSPGNDGAYPVFLGPQPKAATEEPDADALHIAYEMGRADRPKAATVPQGWVAHVSVIDGAFVQPSRHVPDGTYSLVVKDAAPSLPAQSTMPAGWKVRLASPTDAEPFRKLDCKVVDVGYSERVLIVEVDDSDTALPIDHFTKQEEERLTKAEQRMLHDFPFLQQFHTKYALGPKLPPSCLCCGQQTHPYTRPIAIQHAELPGLVICKQCRDAAQSEGEQK